MIHRLHLADVVYPEWHPNTGTGSVYAFAVDLADGLFLVDTGLGPPQPRIDEMYRPTRHPLEDALQAAGFEASSVRGIVVSHLHFDHAGYLRSFPGVPVYVQAAEREDASAPGYTIPEFVDDPGIDYRLLDGNAVIAPGLEVIATPGHTRGHQSVLIDGQEFIAAQAAETVDELSAALLNEWLGRRAENVTAVHLSHDGRVWSPLDTG